MYGETSVASSSKLDVHLDSHQSPQSRSQQLPQLHHLLRHGYKVCQAHITMYYRISIKLNNQVQKSLLSPFQGAGHRSSDTQRVQ